MNNLQEEFCCPESEQNSFAFVSAHNEFCSGNDSSVAVSYIILEMEQDRTVQGTERAQNRDSSWPQQPDKADPSVTDVCTQNTRDQG